VGCGLFGWTLDVRCDIVPEIGFCVENGAGCGGRYHFNGVVF
jgi:hypothetical protein